MTDEQLLTAWRAGDREAGNQLFARYFSGVFRFFRNKVDRGVEDLVQKTFMACVEGRDRLRADTSFRGYLFGAAHHLLRAHYRRERALGREEDADDHSIVDMGASPTSLIGEHEEQRLLLAALRRLPVDYQVALELHYWEGMTAAELGEVLDLPLGTAKTRIRRGRELLEELMATLADSKELLESTRANLEVWARQLRAQVLGDG